MVAGSSLLGPEPSLRDLTRLFPSLSRSREQWDMVAGPAFLAATISGAGAVPRSVASGSVAAPSACSSAHVSAPGVGGASATGLSGLLGRSRGFPSFERCHRRLSSGERSQSGKRCHGGRSPSPVHSSRLARSSASSSSASSGAGDRECVMPPPPAGHPGDGGGRSGLDSLGSGRDRSPCPGPSGLDLESRSLPVPGLSRQEYGGCSSPSPSGAGDDDRSSSFDSLDRDPDGSFWAVLRPIREFHGLGNWQV